MAEYIQNQTIEPTSGHSEALITMAKTHDETETGLTAAFNQTATEQTVDDYATGHAESLFTIAQTINETDTSLTADFNTEFVSQIVYDILLEFGLSSSIGSFDEGGIPIIFYERSGAPEPIIFYERSGAPEPAVFYARGETQRHIDQGTLNKLTAPYNFTYEQAIPTVESTDAQSLITMNQTHDENEAGLDALFSTSVA